MSEEIKEIVAQLVKAKEAYYNSGDMLLTDIQYDTLENRLRELDPDNDFFTIVGASLNGDKIELGERMFSTDKSLSLEEMAPFWNRTIGATEYVVSTKIDGAAVNLEYKDGQIINATTRGDGYVGRSFIQKVGHIPAIRNTLSEKFTGKIRGEIFLTEENFTKLNSILESEGSQLQSNSRNSTSGLLNSQDLTNASKKLPLLGFRVYGVYDSNKGSDNFGSYDLYSSQLIKAAELGFKTVDYFTISCREDFKPETLESWIKEFEVTCDGIVVRVNDQKFARSLGEGKNYLNAVTAFKYKPEQVLVTVKEIQWQVGSKEITPVIIFEPVELDGALISRASGHSVKNLIDIDAVPGRMVTLERSGSVIPKCAHRNKINQ